MAKKPPSNPLLAGAGGSGGFSIADSFGITATLPPLPNAEEDSFVGGGGNNNPPLGPPVTPASSRLSAPVPAPASSMFTSPMSFFSSSPAVPGLDPDPFASVTRTQAEASTSPQSVSLSAVADPFSPPAPLRTPVPPPLSVQGATPLPVSPGPAPAMFMPPQVNIVTPLTSSTARRPTYAPTPFLTNSHAPPAASTPSLSSIPGLPPLPEPKTIHSIPSTQPGPIYETSSSVGGQLPPSQSAPNLSGILPPQTAAGFGGPVGQEVTAHWFYKQAGEQEIWKPFSVEDSLAIDLAYDGGRRSEPVPVDGTRYDAFIDRRVKVPAYWPGRELDIRRCSWFHRHDPEGRWIPYDEVTATKLEEEYQAALSTGRWQVKVVFDSGEWVMLHSPAVMLHFPTSSTSHGALDDWGQVQPQTDPSLRPQVVHRGLDGLPDIPDGETEEVDHLFFVVHGIGAACDMKFRPLEDVVDGFRDLSSEMSEKHFAGAHLASKANRMEYLPVHWHAKLHGEDTGTDSRIQPLTLRSIPKLRSFVNDTLLDVLFYTSPLYCQTILDTVCSEINRIFHLFKSRNAGFQGECSVIGHSLGSLILFDLLSGQSEDLPESQSLKESTGDTGTGKDFDVKMPRWEKDLSMEDVFSKLEITDHLSTFTDQGIGIAELETCSEDDLKEAGLPLGPRKRLLSYLNKKAKRRSGFEEFQASSVARQVSYNFGPAGTGQPSVRYPILDIKPKGFFALGSPIGMFLAVRGIDNLGRDFQFPTCKLFFNIFHPYDPVAYRIESLVDTELADVRPYLVPHHMGRKRMHLELKETMTRMGADLKQKVMDSLKATMGAVYSMAGTITGQELEQEVEKKMREQEEARSESPVQVAGLESQLNSGRRIDFVLQEAPLESFNEYVFAVTSHLCYWESEDTSLMIIKEIYSKMDIFADSEMPQNKLYNPSIAPSFNQYIGPPPVASPPLPRTASVPVNLSGGSQPLPASVNIIGPTPSPHPPAPVPSGPPPSFFNVNTINSAQPPGAGVSRPGVLYPRPAAVPPSVSSPRGPPPVLGMDPTAPAMSDKPMGPPPIGGFTR